MTKTLFIGVLGFMCLYVPMNLIPRLARRFHLLPVWLLAVGLFMLLYWFGALHFTPPQRLLRGLGNGATMATIGAGLVLLRRKAGGS